ncbi:hypothetical protein BC830DRAFT_248740 [Chytriomyces sp. MP71]|nr:hypothetical protein BC830DRAFT_248740 [Chytriomyces sp. MP71]
MDEQRDLSSVSGHTDIESLKRKSRRADQVTTSRDTLQSLSSLSVSIAADLDTTSLQQRVGSETIDAVELQRDSTASKLDTGADSFYLAPSASVSSRSSMSSAMMKQSAASLRSSSPSSKFQRHPPRRSRLAFDFSTKGACSNSSGNTSAGEVDLDCEQAGSVDSCPNDNKDGQYGKNSLRRTLSNQERSTNVLNVIKMLTSFREESIADEGRSPTESVTARGLIDQMTFDALATGFTSARVSSCYSSSRNSMYYDANSIFGGIASAEEFAPQLPIFGTSESNVAAISTYKVLIGDITQELYKCKAVADKELTIILKIINGLSDVLSHGSERATLHTRESTKVLKHANSWPPTSNTSENQIFKCLLNWHKLQVLYNCQLWILSQTSSSKWWKRMLKALSVRQRLPI